MNQSFQYMSQDMRLLVVEDERDLREGLQQALREDGYAVDTAENGDDGLFKARSWDYDAIVLDLMMPGRNGLEVLAELRRTRKTPVLILTARDAVEDRIHGLDSGADDYLVKPFDLGELRARIRALIRRSAGEASATLQAGQVEVDTAGRRVFLDNRAVPLTAREYALVELLVLHQNKVVTRAMIYDHLFDENHDSLSNLIDVYISRLRGKLGKEFIRTRRGEGYVVDA